MKIKSLLLAALLAIPVIASADNPPPSSDTVDKKTPTQPPVANAKASLSNDEVKIVAHLHHVNLMELDLGKAAKLKGTPAVKRYAEMLIKDHGTGDKELLAFAKKKGLAKIPADKPETESAKAEMKEMMASVAAMKKLKGADFDREYLRMMVDGHTGELAKTDVFLASATDADLKVMLEARKTTLTRHADGAKELQKGNAQASATPQPSTKSTK